MTRGFPPLLLPDDVLSLKGDDFNDLVLRTCGDVFKELMEILSINSVQKLLLVENEVLAVFEKNYRELAHISQRACLHLDDGSLMLKPGLRLDFNRLIAALRTVSEPAREENKLDSVNDELSTLLKKLIDSHS